MLTVPGHAPPVVDFQTTTASPTPPAGVAVRFDPTTTFPPLVQDPGASAVTVTVSAAYATKA